MTQFDRFLRNKTAEMRRAAPDCDVWLFPEADGYTAYPKDPCSVPLKPVALERVNTFIQTCTSNGLNVALLDRVSLGQHGGWKTILIAKIPSTKKIEPEDDFA